MPTPNNSAGASNFISAAGSFANQIGQQAATHAQQIQQIAQGFNQFAQTYQAQKDKNAQAMARMSYAKSIGLDPNVAKDEKTGLIAIADKLHSIGEQTHRDWQEKQQAAGFANQEQRDTRMHSFDTEDRDTARQNAEADRVALSGRQLATMNAATPPQHVSPGDIPGLPFSGQRDWTEGDPFGDPGKMSPEQFDRPTWDSIQERARKAEPKTYAPRNIDPLSEEGIAAQEKINAAKPGKEKDEKDVEGYAKAIGVQYFKGMSFDDVDRRAPKPADSGKLNDQQRNRAYDIRQRLREIPDEILQADEKDIPNLKAEQKALREEQQRIAPPVSGKPVNDGDGADSEGAWDVDLVPSDMRAEFDTMSAADKAAVLAKLRAAQGVK